MANHAKSPTKPRPVVSRLDNDTPPLLLERNLGHFMKTHPLGARPEKIMQPRPLANTLDRSMRPRPLAVKPEKGMMLLMHVTSKGRLAGAFGVKKSEIKSKSGRRGRVNVNRN